jgi:hypothetical protein
MQKCLDLKHLLTTASIKYDKKTTQVYYSIGKISTKTNIAKKNFGQEWPIEFFESWRFYLVVGGRGNKQYFIFGVNYQTKFPQPEKKMPHSLNLYPNKMWKIHY